LLNKQESDNPEWINATVKIDDHKSIHFLMYRIDSFVEKKNKPLNWYRLFYAMFGVVLGKDNTSGWPWRRRDVDPNRAQADTGILWAGTNCPDFSFDEGNLWQDCNLRFEENGCTE